MLRKTVNFVTDQVNSYNVHELESVVANYPDGARLQDILDALNGALSGRELADLGVKNIVRGWAIVAY